MSAAVWPPIAPDQLIKEEEASLARELEWLLSSLQETLQSLKDGLEECAALLAPTENGSTLALSTHRSESVKGFVTRAGTRIVKGTINLRLQSLHIPRGQSSYYLGGESYAFAISSAPQAPTLVLEQLTAVRTLINACLDVVDATRWTGNAKDANFISGQLRLLDDNMQEASQTLKGRQQPWWENTIDEKVFDPPLPPNLAVNLNVVDAALVLEIRTLEPFHQPKVSLFNRLPAVLGGSRAPHHDEADEAFEYKGREVRVVEKVRVESQDPNLIATMTKLSALEHGIKLSREALRVVMGREE